MDKAYQKMLEDSNKVEDVIKSCKTKQQVKVAFNLYKLFNRKYDNHYNQNYNYWYLCGRLIGMVMRQMDFVETPKT